MYIMFAESHKILANSIYFIRMNMNGDGGMKNIFDASSNLRQRNKLRKLKKKILSVTYTYGVLYRILKLIQFIPIIMIIRFARVPQKQNGFKIQSPLYE